MAQIIYSKEDIQALRFKWPKFWLPTNIKINPWFSEWMDMYIADAVQATLSVIDENEDHMNYHFMRHDLSLWAAMAYPTCSADKIEKLAYWTVICVLIDDLQEYRLGDNGKRYGVKDAIKSRQLLHESMKSILMGEIYRKERLPPIIRLAMITFNGMFKDFSLTQIKRHIRLVKDWNDSTINENIWLEDDYVIPFEVFKKNRIKSIEMLPSFQLIEYACDIELTDEEFDHEVLIKLHSECAWYTALINELYSMRKEIINNNYKLKGLNHIISIFIYGEGLKFQEAVDKLGHMIEEQDKIIHKAGEEAISHFRDNERVCKFVHECIRLTYVSNAWHVRCRRYSREIPEKFVVSGEFFWNEEKNIIIPDDNPLNNIKYNWLKKVPFRVMNVKGNPVAVDVNGKPYEDWVNHPSNVNLY